MAESITPEPIQEPVSVDDNSSSLTVDNAGLTELAAAIDTEVQVDVVGALPAGNNNIGDVDVASVTGNVTVVQGTGTNLHTVVDSGSITAVASGDHTVVGKAADGAAVSGNPVLVAGQDGTNAQSIKTDTDGELQIDVLSIAAGDNNIGNVDIVTMPNVTIGAFPDNEPFNVAQVGGTAVSVNEGLSDAGTIRVTVATDDTVTVDGTVTANLSATDNAVLDQIELNTDPLLVVGTGTEATAQRVTIATDSTGVLSVDDNGASLTIDNAQLSVVGGGTEAAAMRVTLANDSTGLLSVDDNGGSLTVDQGAAGTAWEIVGDVAHDVGAPTNPVVIGGQMETMADSAPGTRSGTDGDATKLATADGALYVIPTGPQTWSYHENSSSALTDTTVHASPGAGLSLYVTTIVVSTGAATAFNIFFEEGASTVLGPYYLEAVAGRGFAITFGTPKKVTAATALTVTTSAAIAHSIDVTGFVAPG